MTAGKTTVADPNGYYQALGLTLDTTWSQQDIKKAYWSLAKRYHPDGSNPDPEVFRHIQVAYAVLKNPETRTQYDAGKWLDEEVLATIVKGWAQTKQIDARQVTDALRKVTEQKVVPAPPVPRHDGFAYYYYEGEPIPDRAIRERWAATVVQQMLSSGRRGEVRLGFTQGDSHVIVRPWGTVLMVSGDPNTDTAARLLLMLEK